MAVIKGIIVPASKIQSCEKCGGKWGWRQTKEGKWYPAQAEEYGFVYNNSRKQENKVYSYEVGIKGHSNFCVKAQQEVQEKIEFELKEIAVLENFVKSSPENKEWAQGVIAEKQEIIKSYGVKGGQ
jgi:hypothetical protein